LRVSYRNQGSAHEPPTFNPEAPSSIPELERAKIKEEKKAEKKKARNQVTKTMKMAGRERRRKEAKRFAAELFVLAERYDERKEREKAEADGVDVAVDDGEESRSKVGVWGKFGGKRAIMQY
jgi:hypothetical protein